ncbi:hypothetical protein DVH05_012729 [Phytophthora capsici]|nr:hypothetical protein DVH05_012729 [Phytophthora capsici]
MKFFSTLALLAIIAQCTEGHQMLRSASTKSLDFSTLSGSGSDVGSMKHKPRDGSWDGKKPPHLKGSFDGSWSGHMGGRHGPRPPKGSFDGSFDGHHKWAGSFDGSFPGPHGKWPGSFDGSFKGHGKDIPFPGKGKGKKKSNSDASKEEQQTTQQQDGSD